MDTAHVPANRRLLVIDDNTAIHSDFNKILGRPGDTESRLAAMESSFFGVAERAWFEIDCACQGLEGLAMVEDAVRRGQPYSLAFVDVRMPPGLDGIETTRRLWQVDPHLQVVLCTAYSDYSWDEMQEQLGGTDRLLILKKPFDAVEVQQMANALVEKWRLTAEHRLMMESLDMLVRQRTTQLEESQKAALEMRDEAVRLREKEQSAVSDLKIQISRREQIEERFKEQASLLDKARDAIFVADLDGRVSYWNKSCECLYGWTAREAEGQLLTDLLAATARPDYQAAETAARTTGEWVGELRQMTKDGRELVVESRWTLVVAKDGRAESMMVINTDITNKWKIEAHLLRAQRMESIGTLAGGIAHDLNNTLLPIIMTLDVLKMRITEPGLRGMLATMEQSAHRSADMVRHLLTFSRGAEGARRPVEAGAVVAEVEKLLRETFPKNIHLDIAVAEALPFFEGDPTQVHQAILNLCLNSRDAMSRGGRLALRAERVRVDGTVEHAVRRVEAGSYVVFAVEDNGTGIADAVKERIFDPFFTTKEMGKGTGLGLPSVMAIVTSHRGFIAVESEPGRGTKFSVYFPISTCPETASVEPSTEDPVAGHGQLVLVIDDEENIRNVTCNTLEAFGYRALTAKHGRDGVDIYRQSPEPIDVVLTDIMMPVMDGVAAIAEIRRLNPRATIIAASGLQGPAELGKIEGIAHLLAKPYTASTLLAAIETVLAPPASTPQVTSTS